MKHDLLIHREYLQLDLLNALLLGATKFSEKPNFESKHLKMLKLSAKSMFGSGYLECTNTVAFFLIYSNVRF